MLERNEFETHGFGFGAQFGLLTIQIAQLIGSETGVVKVLPRRDQMEDDPGEFVRGGGDGLGSTEFGSHAAIEIAESAFAVVERLGSHAERGRGPAVHFARADPQYLTAANIVVGAQPHPGSECGGAAKLREIGAHFSEQGLSDADTDARDFGQIDAEDASQFRLQDAVSGWFFRLGWGFAGLLGAGCWLARGMELLQRPANLAVAVVYQLLITAIGGQGLSQSDSLPPATWR